MIVIGICGCTPREIEQEHSQATTEEMPRPGGAVQHVLDSIKRELAIKRLDREATQRMIDSIERELKKQESR